MRDQRVMTFAPSSCFHAIRLHFLPSSMILLLLTNGNYLVSGSGEFDTEASDYCRLCERHTGCIFPFDEPGPKCSDIENSDVNNDEIQSIVHQHNIYRNIIARGRETRGNFGPQPAARNMMELTWDHELALLARRWAIQCNPVEKDFCRDVERFAVWQNVNTIKLETKNDDDFEEYHHTSPSRLIPRHVQSWFDEVENFDNARVGLVKFAMENETSYLGIAGGMITHVGCGRATYKTHFEESADEMVAMSHPKTTYHNHDIGTSDRVDVLICNYGPIDRTTPQSLYEYYNVDTDEPCTNKGIVRSNEYDHLCVKSKKVRSFSREAMKNSADDEGSLNPENYNTHSSNFKEEMSRSSAFSVVLRKSTGARSNFQALAEFLALVLLHIIAKAPCVHCC